MRALRASWCVLLPFSLLQSCSLVSSLWGLGLTAVLPPFFWVVEKTLKACWYTHQLCPCVLFGLGGNNLLLVLLLNFFSFYLEQPDCFFLCRVFFSKRQCLLFFLKKQHQPLWLCPMVSLTVHWIVWVLSSYYYYYYYCYYYYYYFSGLDLDSTLLLLTTNYFY